MYTQLIESLGLQPIVSSIFFQIGITIVSIIVFFIFWRKWSPLRSLIAAIVNGIYGINLLSSINSETAGLTIVLTVGLALTLFGVWGIVLWAKLTIKNYQDQTAQSEALENWWSNIRTFDIILIIGLIFRIFIIQPFIVDGPSMDPNFRDKEAIMVDKLSFRLRSPERGEVVVFKAPPQPDSDYIKRVIGLPNETVTIDKGKTYINGKLLSESFLADQNRIPDNTEYFQKTLGPDEYFVMGDNRPRSSDSREWGAVPKDFLIGRAVLAVYPVDMFGLIKTPALNPN